MAYIPNSGQFTNYGGLNYNQQAALDQRNINAQSAAKTELAKTAAEQAKQDLQQSAEAWELKKAQATQGAKTASEFLANWSTSLKNVGDMYGGAMDMIKNITKSMASGASGGSASGTGIPGFDDVIGQMKNAYQDYQTNYAPAAKEFLSQAQAEQTQRTGALTRLDQLATPDYEGARARAITDVGAQANLAREANQREMLGMGVDPTSGKFGALTRKSYLDQAAAEADAANKAVNAEKTRSAALTTQEAALINPNATAQTGINIAKGGTDLLTNEANMMTAASNADTARINSMGALANTVGNLATGYSNAVVNPQAEMAGYFVGGGGGAGALPTGESGGSESGGIGLYNAAQVAALKAHNYKVPGVTA